MLQSPVNGAETPEITSSSSTIMKPTSLTTEPSTLAPADSTSLSSHPLSDPLQALDKPSPNTQTVEPDTPDSGVTDVNSSSTITEAPTSHIDIMEPSPTRATNPDIIDSLTNLPPVPSNMYNISSIDGTGPASLQDNNGDLFESAMEDSVVRPFASVSLSDGGGRHQVARPIVSSSVSGLANTGIIFFATNILLS